MIANVYLYQIFIYMFLFCSPLQLRRKRRKRRRRKSPRSLMTTWALVSLIKMDDFLRKHNKNIEWTIALLLCSVIALFIFAFTFDLCLKSLNPVVINRLQLGCVINWASWDIQLYNNMSSDLKTRKVNGRISYSTGCRGGKRIQIHCAIQNIWEKWIRVIHFSSWYMVIYIYYIWKSVN